VDDEPSGACRLLRVRRCLPSLFKATPSKIFNNVKDKVD